jgi:hypothetical protein
MSAAQVTVSTADLGLLAEVVRSCPTGALRVVDAHGNAL